MPDTFQPFLAPDEYEKYYTPSEYLAIERGLESKNEFYRGKMRDVSGASRYHCLIAGNTLAELWLQTRDAAQLVFPSCMRLKVQATGLYTYPDLSVVNGPGQYEDDVSDTLLNPVALIEIMSPQTEAYDRGDKFEHYQQIASLHHYVLISQEKHRIDHYERQPDDAWLLRSYTNLDDVVDLSSVQCRLALREVYDKVELSDE